MQYFVHSYNDQENLPLPDKVLSKDSSFSSLIDRSDSNNTEIIDRVNRILLKA
jgi:hypothetical protein